ncbi:MAG TPA: hypothetical protein DCS93_24985 [Microscillaceae bacterium]|nr:hypothetical protein [Microscillaceae bacterium]
MIKNYFKVALRNLWKNKLLTFLNIFGLTVGIICTLLLYLYVQYELNYDNFHKDAPQVYKLNTYGKIGGETFQYNTTPGLLAPALKRKFQEVSHSTVLTRASKRLFTTKDKKLFVEQVPYAGEEFFKIFTFRFIHGDPNSALKQPNSIVLTKSIAIRFFGRATDAIGQTVLQKGKHPLKVTGVIEDAPANTHLNFSALISFATINTKQNDWLRKWNSSSVYTYVRLTNSAKVSDVKEKTSAFVYKHMGGEGMEVKLGFQQLTNIHLYNQEQGIDKAGNLHYIYILSSVSLFILLIVTINYMNLATAHSLSRAKEVGVRKVVGSDKKQLRKQFLMEALVAVLAAMLLSLSALELVLPEFNQLVNRQLSFSLLKIDHWLIILGFIVLLTFMSGLYPAFVLSSFDPLTVMKGKYSTNRKGSLVRKCLVVFQFSMSIIMICGTWLMYQQLSFMQNRDLGFDQEQLLAVNVPGENLRDKLDVFQQKLQTNPNIKLTTTTSTLPGHNLSGYSFRFGQEGKSLGNTNHFYVNEDFIRVNQMNILAGRDFSRKIKTDRTKAVVINETLMKRYGWELNSTNPTKNPIGQRVMYKLNGVKEAKAKVIGVVKDFHMQSLHKPVTPTLMLLGDTRANEVLIKVAPQNIKNTLAFIQGVYEELEQVYPFQFQFLDELIAKQYHNDHRQSRVFTLFSGLAILVACLGLLGLALFTVQQRTREIGIRKVLGASAYSIIWLIIRSFVGLVGIAGLIAFPVGYYAMKQWLQGFAYQTTIHWSLFVLVGAIVVGIAVLTISWQALRAASVNPVKVLKDE